MEKQNMKSYSAEHIKCLARKFKKQEGVAHYVALNMAARACGFSNWENFKNQKVSLNDHSHLIGQQKRAEIPTPAALSYHMFPLKSAEKRPNAKMPIYAHQEIAKLIKEALSIAVGNKRAYTAIGQARTTLDDWVQLEYPDTDELPNSIFQAMYFGGDQFTPEQCPSENKKQELLDIVLRIKAIIDVHYHDCQPVKWMHQRFDLAIRWILKWPQGNQRLKGARKPGLLNPGTIVRIKGQNELAIVINHDGWNNLVSCYGDMGSVMAMRTEIVLPREQSGAVNFIPKRLFLPYGKWIFKDGTQILFNRDYCPLWVRKESGLVEAIDPDTWIGTPNPVIQIFKDKNLPSWESKRSRSASRDVLKEWGVEDKHPRLVDQLAVAIKTGDLEDLRPKNPEKLYLIGAN